MDLVLGLSMTSTAVRWLIVEGTTGAGDTVDHGTFDLTAPIDPDDLLDVLLLRDGDDRFHAIGVTWTDDAEDTATGVLDALTARGHSDVIAVSELEAADELAAGIATIADYETVAVCIVEPDAAVVALVASGGVSVDRIARPRDGADAVELPSSVIATLELNDWRPEAIFVVGSADNLDLLVSTIDGAAESPVFSGADADLALTRGAALAAARAVNAMAPARLKLPTKVGALTSIVAASVVTFIVSLAAAIGLGFGSSGDQSPPQAASVVQAQPPPPSHAPVSKERLTESLAQARPLVAQTMVVAVPPAPEVAPIDPADELPAAPPPAVAPPPVYTAPAPAYVPPVPKPRLRDRIIERIPIINRFHEPQYQYGP